jgi:alpha-L-rhamnosidase
MKQIIASILTGLIIHLSSNLAGQSVAPALLKDFWPAKWISTPGTTGQEFGVYLFRKILNLQNQPQQFIIHVSADNRYKLYVNGSYIGNGPARGDLMKWYFETYDISKYLKPGNNVISAVVWNFAEYRPVAQFSSRTGLIIQADNDRNQEINTNKSWLVRRDDAYEPVPVKLNAYYVVGPGEKFSSANHPWNWMSEETDLSTWRNAVESEPGTPVQALREYGSPPEHVLYPRQIPPMEETKQYFGAIRRATLPKIPEQFIKGGKALVIPANSTTTILLDQQHLTTAYPVLSFSGGRNSSIKITYAESLVDDKKQKGNRNDIEGKSIIGNSDIVLPDGSTDRIYQTLWWRTFRYVELEITTKEESLTLNSLHSIFTGYPFQEKASFRSSDASLSEIWNVGWRTQRLCAAETYFDCPYYEQLQYAGDTRIQAYVSTYVSGDGRLVKSALESFRDSHLPFGLTQSRYPSYQTQVIPPFSLIWVTMVHDYWMLNDDPAFVKSTIPAILDVLQWYEAHIDSTGILGHMEWWNFVDWVDHDGWVSGIPPGARNGNSSIITLQYVYALQKAADVFKAFGFDNESTRCLDKATVVKNRVRELCFDSSKGLIADIPARTKFSQHANVLAILTNTLPEASHPDVFRRLTRETGIAQCSFYFEFYLIEAMRHCGLEEEYNGMLTPWRTMVKSGLTTFAEKADPTRSDCHAWSASPVYHMLSLIGGITPAEPGFKSVNIEPHFGNLQWFECSMPHASGNIMMNVKKNKDGDITGKIDLPANLSGTLVWKGNRIVLKPGPNEIGAKK